MSELENVDFKELMDRVEIAFPHGYIDGNEYLMKDPVDVFGFWLAEFNLPINEVISILTDINTIWKVNVKHDIDSLPIDVYIWKKDFNYDLFCELQVKRRDVKLAGGNRVTRAMDALRKSGFKGWK